MVETYDTGTLSPTESEVVSTEAAAATCVSSVAAREAVMLPEKPGAVTPSTADASARA